MASVVVINPFEVSSPDMGSAVESWDRFAAYFRKQPGYISSALHQSVDGQARFGLVTVAHWESADHFFRALQGPELARLIENEEGAPESYPGVYQVIR